MNININKRNIFLIAVWLVSIGYFFSYRIASWTVILLMTASLFNLKKKLKTHLFSYKKLIPPILFFITLIIGLTYTENLDRGLKIVERFISFLLIPLIFMFTKPLDEKEREKIELGYIYSVSAFYVICFLTAVYRQILFNLSHKKGINWYYFYRYDFLEVFNQHPTYVAMFALLSLSLLLFKFDSYFKNAFSYYLLIFIHVFGIVLTGSRMGYIVLFALGLLYLHKAYKNHKKSLPTLISLLLIIVLSLNIPIVKERFLFTFAAKYNYRYNSNSAVKKGNPEKQGRLTIWTDALELIQKRPWIGWGTGSDNDVLQQIYKEKNQKFLIEKGYNAHNSYLQWWLSGGILLLLAYLLFLGTILTVGLQQKDYILLMFFLIISMVSLTETFYRVQGIIFIVFFYSYFITKYYLKPKYTTH